MFSLIRVVARVVAIHSLLRTLVEVWEGDLDMRTALRSRLVRAQGSRHLIHTMPDWFGVCLYKDVRRGDPDEGAAGG